MTHSSFTDAEALRLVRQDADYHQLRVLLLVDAVARTAGHAGKLDGLTKLAKLDFLLRYPALAPVVLEELDEDDAQLDLGVADRAAPTAAEAPMVRYKYGPWDDRYYPVIGALVGRGLLQYRKGRHGSVALAPTPAGRRLATTVSTTAEWGRVAHRAEAIARGAAGMSGNALKERIYDRLPDLMDRPQREVIR